MQLPRLDLARYRMAALEIRGQGSITPKLETALNVAAEAEDEVVGFLTQYQLGKNRYALAVQALPLDDPEKFAIRLAYASLASEEDPGAKFGDEDEFLSLLGDLVGLGPTFARAEFLVTPVMEGSLSFLLPQRTRGRPDVAGLFEIRGVKGGKIAPKQNLIEYQFAIEREAQEYIDLTIEFRLEHAFDFSLPPQVLAAARQFSSELVGTIDQEASE